VSAAALMPDPELQADLARHALAGFNMLLAHVPPATALPSEQIGAIVRLISQAGEAGLAEA
jgi:hypothetical protein